MSDLEFDDEIEIDIYPYLKNIKKVKCNDVISLNWKLNNTFADNIIELNKKELYICNSPDNPNVKDRTTILIRDYSKECTFYLQWKFK